MARYILTHKTTGAIKGQPLEQGGERPFVCLAEAFEMLANLAVTEGKEPSSDFHAWQVLELRNVED